MLSALYFIIVALIARTVLSLSSCLAFIASTMSFWMRSVNVMLFAILVNKPPVYLQFPTCISRSNDYSPRGRHLSSRRRFTR